MADPKDDRKPELLDWKARMAEEIATSAPGAVIGAMTGSPVMVIGGAAAGIAVKGVIGAVRNAFASRTRARAERFEAEIARLLESGDAAEAVRLTEQNDEFAEIIFQNYRRAMDAPDPQVIPPLARLTLAYQSRKADGFFRSLGDVLEALVGDEFEALQLVFSGTVLASAQWDDAPPVVEVTPYHQEIRFTSRKNRGRPWACLSPKGILRVLDVIERNGLALGFQERGTDLALTNRLELAVESCERVLGIIGGRSPELFKPTKNAGP